jgi:hypothetical protein
VPAFCVPEQVEAGFFFSNPEPLAVILCMRRHLKFEADLFQYGGKIQLFIIIFHLKALLS